VLEVAVSDLLVELRVYLLRVYSNRIGLDDLVVTLIGSNTEDIVRLLDTETVKRD